MFCLAVARFCFWVFFEFACVLFLGQPQAPMKQFAVYLSHTSSQDSRLSWMWSVGGKIVICNDMYQFIFIAIPAGME